MLNLPQVSYTITGFSSLTRLIATQSPEFPVWIFMQIAVILNRLKIFQVLWSRNSTLLAEVPSRSASGASGSGNHTSQNLSLAMTWPSSALGNAEPAAASCRENKPESSLADDTFQGCFSHPRCSTCKRDSCFASWRQKCALRGEKKTPSQNPKCFSIHTQPSTPVRCPLTTFCQINP